MESLHARTRILWIVSGLLWGAVAAFVLLAVDRWLYDVPAEALGGAVLVVSLLGAVYGFRRYQVWRFEIQPDALYLERGVITFVETAVPFVRVQHVDTQFGPLERALGLSSVVVYTAGSRNADVRVPGLRPERARKLQDTLRELAVESETEDAV
ncbi:PH domain-containing protein [Halovivax gelatinilyticus]|uniref:PH domain-containing protein n=1 Tax=Halovivax gelatinilyticus TaxID=2961597 RepID=UPI0020CA2DE2|nr:PH domain-containing protein [Halovivax gelatinilyticus]